MALPNFADASDAVVTDSNITAGTIGLSFDCMYIHGNTRQIVNTTTAPFLVSGGIAAYDTAVVDACVAMYNALFNVVLPRTSVAFVVKKLGS